MPPLTPVSRRKLIQNLHHLGFEGPYSGGSHQFLIKGELRLMIPNPHTGNITAALLARILRQAKISRQEWDELMS
jgi:predicted RNA binding protein YcfA (HicA-like mRNA interferase family)